MEPMQAFEYLCSKRKESTRSQIFELVGKLLPIVPDGVNTEYRSLTELA